MKLYLKIIIFVSCCTFSLSAKSIISYSAMPQKEQCRSENMQVDFLDNNTIKLTSLLNSTIAYIEIPFPRKKIDVCDFIDFKFDSLDNDVQVIFEFCMNNPVGTSMMKRTFRLQKGENNCSRSLNMPGITKDASFFRLTIKSEKKTSII